MKRVLLLVVCAATACGGAELRGRKAGVESLIVKARKQGAYRCAPTQLALAEAHVEFAAQELAEGHGGRADDELDIAEKNARLAVEKSPAGSCVSVLDGNQAAKNDRDHDGWDDDEDRCPLEAEDTDGYRDDDGCPDPDNDRDGIVDIKDQCPNAAEDMDGHDDDDGCPDGDDDNDGIADESDQCPDEAEDRDGHEDADGCPDPDNDGDGVPDYPEAKDRCPGDPGPPPEGCPTRYKLIEVRSDRIELGQHSVYFNNGKAQIKVISYPVLDEVAAALVERPELTVRIEGHTDSRGNDRRNLRLSQQRADAVKGYLVGKGVRAARLEALGLGETVPIADNRTSQGREQNRRVDFVITSARNEESSQ